MFNKKIKVAVIGTGAAGFGALSALLDKKSDFDIVVYDIGRQVMKPEAPDNPSDEWISSFYGGVYKEIRSRYPFKFPPPKTHFARQIPRQSVGGSLNIFKSESMGGLTNYWGATMLPFTDREMAGWPVKKEDLYPYYQKVSEIAGLAAYPDALNKYFGRDFATRPPIKPTHMLYLLDRAVNGNSQGNDFEIFSGLNRCGVETRPERQKTCVYCGECLAGCFRDAIFSTRMKMEGYFKDPRVKQTKGKVARVSKKDNWFEIGTDQGERQGGFAKVFLAAGCPATTEIVMRSLEMKESLVMRDNAVYVFPILYLGRRPKEARHKEYLSLCNLIFACVPRAADKHFAQVQIYPNFDYLWRYNTPNSLWRALAPLAGYGRSRLFWARLYLHSDYSQSYDLRLENDQLVMAHREKPAAEEYVKTLMVSLRRAVNRRGFYLPPMPPVLQKVNSHYAATLPFNGPVLKNSALAEMMPGWHICDSSVFPDSPAINPAFTSMANAYRIADQALT